MSGKVMRLFGHALVVAGLGIALFVVFMFLGTGIEESNSQAELSSELAGAEAQHQVIGEDTSAVGSHRTWDSQRGVSSGSRRVAAPVESEPGARVPRELVEYDEGSPVGRITIPAIGVDQYFVHGIGEGPLRAGPGHYPTTALPGLVGNAAIAGHRTTYGAPFNRIGDLAPGDQISVETHYGSFDYQVIGQGLDGVDGHFIVSPTDVWVLEDEGDNRLTLTTCHPMHSDRERLVVVAELIEQAISDVPFTRGSPSRRLAAV